MEQEYRISTWYKYFYGIIAIILLVFSIYFFSLQKPNNLFLLFIPLFFLIFSILIVVNFIKRKLVINEKSILCINLFSEKELNISAIKGYRLGSKSIIIEPISENDSKLIIGNYIDFENREDISEWVVKNFKDLDTLDLESENQKFLKDTAFGSSESERIEKLKSSKEIATAYNFISGLLGFILAFKHNDLSYIILLILPIIGIILFFSFDLIKLISEPKRSIYAYIFIGFIIPCVTLLIKTSEYKLLSFDPIWLWIGIVFFIMFSLLYFKGIDKSEKSLIGQMILMLIISILYGFGSVRAINCAFDKSKETVYSANVIDLYITRGRHRGYYLKLGSWGPQNKSEDEEVSKKMYDKTNIGDIVNVKYKEGFLKAPWYEVLTE